MLSLSEKLAEMILLLLAVNWRTSKDKTRRTTTINMQPITESSEEDHFANISFVNPCSGFGGVQQPGC
jgi:hypothetical protein